MTEAIDTPNTMRSLAEQYEDLKSCLNRFDASFNKFDKNGVKTAATSARFELLAIKKLADSMRVQILEKVKSLPIKNKTVSIKEQPEEIVHEPSPPPPTPITSLDDDAAVSVVRKMPRKPRKVTTV